MQLTPNSLKERFVKLVERSQVRCGILSVRPVVIHFQLYCNLVGPILQAFQPIFQSLQSRPIYLLCSLGGPGSLLLKDAVDLKARLAQAFPHAEARFLCNELTDVSRFQAQGLDAIHCNHNAFVAETIFQPDARMHKEFDAVYDARLAAWKRHDLAISVASLGLLYYAIPGVEDPGYVAQIKREFSHAHFFNHESGAYRFLLPEHIAGHLNRCRVGLCLSATEGAMYASAQYLLCGLKVVSTPSTGGRAEFFDERYCQIVEPDPVVIQRAVSELAARPIEPALIRRETLARMQPHRQRLLELVQKILGEQGETRDFAREWPQVFRDKLLQSYPLRQVLEKLGAPI